MTTLHISARERVRSQLVVAVRRALPVLDAETCSTITLSRTVCPALTEQTWATVNGTLPIDWAITEIRETQFVMSVSGRKAQ